MASDKAPQTKSRLHPRNRNREPYDLNALVAAVPELQKHVGLNKFGDKSVNFSNPDAVKLLNQAILTHYYNIKYWDFPKGYLTPPIPGRADYLHYVADLLAKSNNGQIPQGRAITCLDVGVGASCIYPIIGVTEYGWTFIGSDTGATALKSAKNIVAENPQLTGAVSFRFQTDADRILRGVLKPDDRIDVSICNPPFHSSEEEAQRGTRRKVRNLTGKNAKSPKLNFSGQHNELVYEGGELAFIRKMIYESQSFADNCMWFTTLVSKSSNLHAIHQILDRVRAERVRTIEMGTGNKTARIVAWSFLHEGQQEEWAQRRWL